RGSGRVSRQTPRRPPGDLLPGRGAAGVRRLRGGSERRARHDPQRLGALAPQQHEARGDHRAGEQARPVGREGGVAAMSKSLVAAALAVGALCGPLSAAAPLRPGYKVGEPLQLLFHEYRVTGPNPGTGCALVCTYSTRPVVMVYTREIDAPLRTLIR